MKASVGGIARGWLVPALALLLGGCAVTTPNVKESFKSNFRYQPVRARGTIEANVWLETSHALSEGVVATFKRYGNSQANVDAWREAVADATRDDMFRSGFVKPLPAGATPELIVKVESSESDTPESHLTVVVSVLDPAAGSVTARYERRADLGTSIFAYTGNMRKGLSTALAEIREDLLRDYRAGKVRRAALASRRAAAVQEQPRPGVAAGTNDGRAAPATTRKAVPGQRSYWGFVIEDVGGQGVSLTAVKNDSPAGTAGLEAGDVLLSINGVPVHSVQEFRAVKNTFPFFTPLKLTLKRSGAPLERTISLYGIVPLKLKPARVEFSIPGVPPPPTPDALSAVTALDQVNVLDQVVLDPGSGKIAIIGHHDARFNTGPIPYLDMLKTALVYPKPKFNLGDPGDKSVDRLAAIEQTLWDWPTQEFVLAHPELEQDRQLLLQVWASACGVWPEELTALFNYVNFARKDVTPPAHIRRIQAKILRNLGFAEAAEAYELVNESAAEAPLKALQLLGRNAEAQTILAGSGGDPAKARGALTAAVYLAIMERIHAPEAAVVNLRHDLARGRSTWQEVVATAQGSLLPSRSNADRREIAKTALNKIMLSPRGTKALFKKIEDLQTRLEPIDLDRTSQLTRILYEADYSLKSRVVMPQLFRHIPGAVSLQEYEMRRGAAAAAGVPVYTITQHWLEPKSVAMTVSPGRRVVSFGPVQMAYDTLTFDGKGGTVGDGRYDEWRAGLMNNYDDYARALPAFHKVREAAKVIALANWLIAEKMRVDLSGVVQEKWDAPDTITDLWRVGLSYVAKGDDEYIEKIQIGHTGGVTFKKQNWTQVTPAPPASETGASSQLALSAGLGQRAVQAAQGGDLEAARHLAELSAQAMTGRLSKGDLAKMNIAMPDAKPAPVSPGAVQLQQAMLQRTNQQIAALRQNPASAAAAAGALKELNSLYDEVRDKPVAASDYLVKLQTRQVSPPATSRTATVEPAAETVCGDRVPGGTTLATDRKAHMSKRLGDARDRLRYINEALKKLIAINAAERAEIEKLTAEISTRYEEAQDRAWDVVLDLLGGVSLDAFAAEQAKRLKGIDDAIAAKIALKTTPQNAASLRAIEEEIILLQSAKFRSEEAYAATAHLVDGLKMSKYGKDVDDWRRENEDDWERAKSGLALAANLFLDHPALERWLGKKAFFAGEKLWQVATMGRMAYYAAGFAYDILAQWAVWEPMTHRMQNDLKYNVQAIERLRQRAEQTSKEIGCLENLLR